MSDAAAVSTQSPRDTHDATQRVSDTIIAKWQREGVAVAPAVFTQEELAPVLAEYERLHPRPAIALDQANHADLGPRLGRFDKAQFENVLPFPFDANIEMNLLPLHPLLIDVAKRALGVDDVIMYQCHTWAKFTGDADYSQPFHMDFGNHTLLVPGDEKRYGTINFIIYLTEVTATRGALAYVPRSVAQSAGAGEVRSPRAAEQILLHKHEQLAEVPARTLLLYDTDTFHRGINLTEPGGHRYSMTVSYRARDFETMGGNEWSRNGDNAPWVKILSATTVEQAVSLGIPRPGHPYWTSRTIERTQVRYPDWNLSPWRDALRV